MVWTRKIGGETGATTATDELAFPISYKGGYEVAEYNMSEYSVDTEYATSEYKSIYD
jgi:hypothetical protein